MERPSWASEGADIEQPSAARLYDYALGGSHNLAVDRELFRQLTAVMPDLAEQARLSRAFLRRALYFCAAAGIRQFLDVGSGIPARGNAYEVVRRIAPDARVMYVNTDPVPVPRRHTTVTGDDRVGVVQADIRQTDLVIDHPDVRRLLDFDGPVAVLLVAVLHLVSDRDDPPGIVARLREAMAPGSFLVISHGSRDGRPQAIAEGFKLLRGSGLEVTLRPRQQVERLFAGFDMVEPGLVWAPQWRPERPEDLGEHPEQSVVLVGVGRKT